MHKSESYNINAVQGKISKRWLLQKGLCPLLSSAFSSIFQMCLEKFEMFLVDFLCSQAQFWQMYTLYILKNLVGSRTNLKGLIHLILIKFICETINVLSLNIMINKYIIVLYFFAPAMVHMEMLVTFAKKCCIFHLLPSK